LGSRSRKRSRSGAPGPAKTKVRRTAEPRVSRSEARDAAVRAELQPLEPGERPLPLVVAALLAGFLSVFNLVLYLAGTEIDGSRPNAFGTLLFCALMLVAAVGMWRQRYWAVLGFQTILGLIVVLFSIFLLRASNLLAVAVAVAVIGLAGWLFIRLVRVMARIQMPERRR
jgi:hypothetical protein